MSAPQPEQQLAADPRHLVTYLRERLSVEICERAIAELAAREALERVQQLEQQLRETEEKA